MKILVLRIRNKDGSKSISIFSLYLDYILQKEYRNVNSSSKQLHSKNVNIKCFQNETANNQLYLALGHVPYYATYATFQVILVFCVMQPRQT